MPNSVQEDQRWSGAKPFVRQSHEKHMPRPSRTLTSSAHPVLPAAGFILECGAELTSLAWFVLSIVGRVHLSVE